MPQLTVTPTSQTPGAKSARKGPAVVGNAPQASGAAQQSAGVGLPLPHERAESAPTVAPTPDPVIEQAARDLDAGLVDTDMRATPGLDAQRRARLVPGAGGKTPAKAG